MVQIFKKSNKKKIDELRNQIFDFVRKNKQKIDSCGIEDGSEIILEYLDQNELGLAYEHLDYVISEVNFKLNAEQTKCMIYIAKKLGIKK